MSFILNNANYNQELYGRITHKKHNPFF